MGRWEGRVPVMAQRIVRFVVLPTGIALCALLVVALGWKREPQLDMPVEGFMRTQVRSSFGAPRDGGKRQHHGIDLFASTGTPVLAATSGVVVFKGWNELGGRAVYVFGEGVLTYYAHLDSWRPGLHLGERVVRGTRLGAVGTSGNASGTPPHLHFAVQPLWNLFAAVDPAPRLGSRRVPPH
jgi:murein DD-endopeptidase MepM/ murein hydrolase activator NlpD